MWHGAEFIINGSVVENKNELKLSYSLTRVSDVKIITSKEVKFANKDKLLDHLEKVAAHISLEVTQNAKVKEQAKDNDESLFKNIESQELFEYYSAVKLIEAGQDS